MRKHPFWLLCLLTCLTVLFFSRPVQGSASSVDDQSGLFTTEESNALNEKIAEVDQRFKGQLFIVTTNSNNDSVRNYADDYLLDKISGDKNGAVLVIDMGQREFYISTSGNMIDYLTDSRLETILDDVYDEMVSSNYYAAANVFLTSTDQYITAGIPNKQYQIDEETGKITYYKALTPVEILIAFAAALAVAGAFFLISLSKYRLKWGSYKYPFREKGSLNLVDRSDHLTNSFVTTRRIPRNNGGGGGGRGGGGGSTTHSRGGGTFGGGGRSF